MNKWTVSNRLAEVSCQSQTGKSGGSLVKVCTLMHTIFTAASKRYRRATHVPSWSFLSTNFCWNYQIYRWGRRLRQSINSAEWRCGPTTEDVYEQGARGRQAQQRRVRWHLGERQADLKGQGGLAGWRLRPGRGRHGRWRPGREQGRPEADGAARPQEARVHVPTAVPCYRLRP